MKPRQTVEGGDFKIAILRFNHFHQRMDHCHRHIALILASVSKTGNIMAELADILGFRVCFNSLKKPLYGLNRQVENVFLVCSYN